MKIIIIGCPGSGKSTLTRKLCEMLNYPVLHLDKIYHIDNERHITREELKEKVYSFATENKDWIIDGNYKATISQRVELADTVILLDMDTKICLENAKKRATQEQREDIAKGFNIKIINDGFLEFIESFKKDTLPEIMKCLKEAKNKNIIILRNYEDVDSLLTKLKTTGKL